MCIWSAFLKGERKIKDKETFSLKKYIINSEEWMFCQQNIMLDYYWSNYLMEENSEREIVIIPIL